MQVTSPQRFRYDGAKSCLRSPGRARGGEVAFGAMNARNHIAPFVVAASLSFGCGDAGRLETACTSNTDCADDAYCASGFCGGFGQCVARPDPIACEAETNNPVCGCDGVTYPKRCEAQIAGVQLQFSGPCVCEENAECAAGQFCALDDSCSDPGFCLDVPETCEPDDTVVCGCDGNTYASRCAAAQAAVRVAALGACDAVSARIGVRAEH